jgi:glycosyltransferase involved in cell wall biosynthesis
MTIVIVSLNGVDNSGGVERVSWYLREMLSRRYPVLVLSRTKFSFGKFDIIIQPLLMSLRLFFLDVKDKLVISNSWNSFLYPVDFSIMHGTTQGTITRIPSLKFISTKLMVFFEKVSVRNAKKNLAVSQDTKEEMTTYYHIRQEKITVFNNFVDEKIFYPMVDRNSIAGTDDIHILFCGRLETRKGLDTLKKLSDYIEKTDGFSLIVACNKDENTGLFYGNKKTYIRIGLGINDICAFYNSGDILFFPTLYEGFSMSTLEALCCGIPVLGTAEAVKDGLRDYDFVDIIDLGELDDLFALTHRIRLLVERCCGKKKEIHRTIVRDFGYEQYEERLLSLIENTAV